MQDSGVREKVRFDWGNIIALIGSSTQGFSFHSEFVHAAIGSF